MTGTFKPGAVTFTVRVSSEENDGLAFSIDGMSKGFWSGEQAGLEVSVPIKAGTHTLVWSYVKDESDAAGNDAAWIDDVVLPLAQ